jgi:DNA polymerase elongation subunit (family B)
MTRKIQLNSFYGALTNLWFRWFDLDNAEAITMSGQFAIRYIERAINEYLNGVLKTNKDRVIAIDTDSVYVCLDDLI